MRIRLLPEAERDLQMGADFYDSQQPGLGTYFNDSLIADIESLQIYAGIHERYHGFQCGLAKRFPFSLYYILTDDCVDIYTVLDARQVSRNCRRHTGIAANQVMNRSVPGLSANDPEILFELLLCDVDGAR